MQTLSLETLLTHAIEAARRAGETILALYEAGHSRPIKKADDSFVTDADLASERTILSILPTTDIGVLSEEMEATTPGAKQDAPDRLNYDYVWIIDPLDGTNDFLLRTGEFSVMIGLAYKHEPVLGVVYQPTTRLCYYAIKGSGAFRQAHNEQPVQVRVSTVTSLSEAKLVVSRTHFSHEERAWVGGLGAKSWTQMGSLGLKCTAVADGSADGTFTFTDKTSEWDLCAPQIIVREANGLITDLTGAVYAFNRMDTKNRNGMIAGNHSIHEAMRSQLPETRARQP